jgi:hypothetical protein
VTVATLIRRLQKMPDAENLQVQIMTEHDISNMPLKTDIVQFAADVTDLALVSGKYVVIIGQELLK